jgi:hypothetical protein
MFLILAFVKVNTNTTFESEFHPRHKSLTFSPHSGTSQKKKSHYNTVFCIFLNP